MKDEQSGPGHFALPLSKRVALVTGAAQGIGKGIAEGIANAGAAIAIVDVQIEKAAALAQQLVATGKKAVAIEADIATEAGCQAAIAQTIDALGTLDMLVNNAAPGRNPAQIGRLANSDWTIHEQVILQATAHLTDAALPHLEKSGHGSVVNISSAVGTAIATDHCSWPYHVSKAGLNHLTRWLASRLGPRGIRVNAVAPGLVDRDVGMKLTDNPDHRALVETIVPLRRAGCAADIARAVVFLCSDQSSYITGQILCVDGGVGLEDVFSISLRAYQEARPSDTKHGKDPQ